jgi:hypothetical protein
MRLDASLGGRVAPAPQKIVHLGQSALVLEAATVGASFASQFIVTTAAAGVMPGGISLGATDFARVRNRLSAVRPGLIDLTAWNVGDSIVEPVDLRVHSVPISGAAIRSLTVGLSRHPVSSDVIGPQPLRRRASRLAYEAATGCVGDSTLKALVGAGPGTTPTGDDIIVGTLAGLRAASRPEHAATLGRQLSPMLGATTTTAAHYLAAAIDGRFGEHVHEFIAALSAGAPTNATIELASRWGATSGVDLLVGLVSTLAAVDNSGGSEEEAA